MSKCKEMEHMTTMMKICRNRPIMFNDLFLNRPRYWSRHMESSPLSHYALLRSAPPL